MSSYRTLIVLHHIAIILFINSNYRERRFVSTLGKEKQEFAGFKVTLQADDVTEGSKKNILGLWRKPRKKWRLEL